MATLSHADLLKRLPLFKSLSASQAQALAHASHKQRFKRNEFLAQAGQQSNALTIILSGTARVLLTGENGRQLAWGSLQPGDYVGEMSLLDDQPNTASVVAATALDALVLENSIFNACLLQNGSLALAVMRGMVSNLRKANQKMSDLALSSVYDRVARYLIEAAQPIDTGDTAGPGLLAKKIAKSKLAHEVGASREMVSRALKELETQGLIQAQEDGSFRVSEALASARKR